jgi:hypothetical protein
MGTGYEISLEEFATLVSNQRERGEVVALLRAWFGCEPVADEGNPIVFRGADGATWTLEALHARIQGDREKQERLYHAAMTLWR